MMTMPIPKCLLFILLLIPFSMQNAQEKSQEKYKILALMPYNGKSHFDFAVVLFEELARRGHDVTVLSQFSRKTPLPNYHEISVADERTSGVHLVSMDEMSSKWDVFKMMVFFKNGLHRLCEQGLSHPNVQKLLKSHEDKYDLVITEMFNADCFLGFVHKFNTSLITIRTSTLSTWLNDRTGNPDNPSYVPGTTSGYPSRMNFMQRFGNTVYNVVYKMLYRVYDSWCEEIARRHFGGDTPSLESIAKRSSLYLINTHFVNQFAKPLMRNVKEIAGMHVQKPKALPKDLEHWISTARHGIIYLNFGSMLKPSSMARHKWSAFVRVFAQLQHRVLVKWDAESVEDLPENARLTAWAPQNDVLHHPNTKLFITHGGMLGTVEALDAGVPMVVVPFFGDQMTNAALLEERGLGLRLMYDDITFESLNRTLSEVLFHEGYATRAKQLSAAFRDRPLPPLEEAVFWVEYVMRHRNTAAADSMRSPSLDLRLYEYLLLDVLAAMLVIFVVVWLMVLYVSKIIRCVVQSILRLVLGRQSEVERKKKTC